MRRAGALGRSAPRACSAHGRRRHTVAITSTGHERAEFALAAVEDVGACRPDARLLQKATAGIVAGAG
jgi:hypothetical protein